MADVKHFEIVLLDLLVADTNQLFNFLADYVHHNRVSNVRHDHVLLCLIVNNFAFELGAFLIFELSTTA